MVKIFLPFCLILFACKQKEEKKAKQADRFYYYSSLRHDTVPAIVPLPLDSVGGEKVFEAGFPDQFQGKVIKLVTGRDVIDGEAFVYWTPDLGVIYGHNTTWGNYKRLHSTNDSIERRICDYIDHIMASTNFLRAGILDVRQVGEINQVK